MADARRRAETYAKAAGLELVLWAAAGRFILKHAGTIARSPQGALS
jgi:hypothetical protein